MMKPVAVNATINRKGMQQMTAMIDLMKTMARMSPLWRAWLGLLVGANFIVPLFYIHTIEAQVIFVAATVSMVIMSAVFSEKGFVRLLGIGHITWLPLVFWLSTRLDHAPPDSIFGYWLMSVIVLDSLSLMIDTTDVVRYINGERSPYGVESTARKDAEK